MVGLMEDHSAAQMEGHLVGLMEDRTGDRLVDHLPEGVSQDHCHQVQILR